MKQRISTCLMILVTVPLFAGDIHGKVSAKSMKDAANAVVYVDGIAGKTFPVPAQHVTVDQKNMQFVPEECGGRRGNDG